MPELVLIQNFAQALGGFGVPLPERATNALAIWQAANTLASAQPADTLRADFEAGRVTADNVAARVQEAATQAVAADRARELTRELIVPITRAASRDVAAHADDIIRSLRPAWDEAAERMAEGARQGVSTASAEQILDSGQPEAVAAATRLSRDRATLDAILGIRRQLAAFGHRQGVEVANFIRSARNTDQLDHAAALLQQDDGRGGRWLNLTAAGFALALNTLAEGETLVAAAHGATAAARDAQQALHNKDVGRGWNLSVPARAAS